MLWNHQQLGLGRQWWNDSSIRHNIINQTKTRHISPHHGISLTLHYKPDIFVSESNEKGTWDKHINLAILAYRTVIRNSNSTKWMGAGNLISKHVFQLCKTSHMKIYTCIFHHLSKQTGYIVNWNPPSCKTRICLSCIVNSSFPSAAYMRQWIGPIRCQAETKWPPSSKLYF